MFLHVLGASLWVGGAITILVVNRLLRRTVPAEAHREALTRVGRGAMPLLLGGLAVAALTGLELLRLRGYGLNPAGFQALANSTFGLLLGWKALAILASVGAAAAHGILAARGRPVRGLALVTVVTGLLILFLGAGLRWAA
ncbi:MAG TPA: hypothetical protein VNZ52_15390 [Candidatus Thermoplasmatota archaeon]|nr:hypothetical protein [Candidatus Thermoplasmatota archaeon]